MGAGQRRVSSSKTLLLFALSWFFLAAVALPARADEVIESFHAAIDLSRSGKMTVTETIRVRAEGYKIKRGIFRDFPLTFIGEDNQLHRVDFDIVGIERDGAKDDYKTEAIDGGIRIYIGKEDVFLPRGDYTYSITYETGRQVRYRKDFDELFWNVTGNGWDFPIREASATIVLPDGVRAEDTTFFTGPLGATDKNARVLEEGNEVFFATTIPLNLHEGLTVGVKLPKGVMDPPSQNDLFWWWIKDRSNSILAGVALAIVLLYFLWHWVRVGRDPSRGVIVPRWDAPMGMSPALVNYVANRGFSNGGWTAFSASAINLAVKGHIVLADVKEKLAMKLTDKIPDTALPSGEDVIYGTVAGAGTLRIDKANGRTLQTMGEKFRLLIDKEHTGKYYRYNLGIIVWGIILTVMAYLAVVFFGTFDTDMLGLLVVPAFIFVFVAIFSAVLIAVMKAAPVMVMKVVAGFFLAVFWLAFALIVAVSAMELLKIAKTPDDIIALACCGAMIVTAVIFVSVMGAATPLGRQLMDGIEGLRLYLTVAEKDRMNLAGAPEMSPQHFEKMLPFAVALGVEKPWAEHFQTWLDAAGVNQNYDYKPGWYTGREFDHKQFGNRMSSFSSSLSSQISSSLPPPPKSSSSGFSSSSRGGGGGSSGGGGGGGGGGGW